MKHSDTVILHDEFAFKGGGERLVQILCRDLKADLALGCRNNNTFNLDKLPNKLINLESESNLEVWRTIKLIKIQTQPTDGSLIFFFSFLFSKRK